MSLRLFHHGWPEDAEAVIFCDVELADDCHAIVELGERSGWTEQQYHELAQSSEYGWRFDTRTRRDMCPPCQRVDQRRRQAATLAGEGFPAACGPRQPDPGPQP